MGLIWFMKALADISAYYLFAAPIAAYFGSGALLLCVLLQASAYALARCLKHKWLLSLPLCIAALGFWLCRDLPADLIAQTPALLYLVWQYAQQGGPPELTRQKSSFAEIWKLLLPAMLLGLIVGKFHSPVPYIFLAFFSNAALLRTLRHKPSVYLRPEFQLMNLGILALVPLTAFSLGAGPVKRAFTASISWVYHTLLLPLFMGILYLPGQLLQKLLDFLKPIFDSQVKPQDETQPAEKMEQAAEDILASTQEVPPAGKVLQEVLLVLLIIGAIVGIILLFRKLGKKNTGNPPEEPVLENRTLLSKAKKPAPEADTSTVQAVRKYYRRYLKLCVKSGIPLQQSSTSGEICNEALTRKALKPQAGRIRQLYIRARYAGLASKEDAKEMGKLCAESKKEA